MQLPAQSAGGVALAVILLGSILAQDWLEIQREDLRAQRMQEDGCQASVVIRDDAVAMLSRCTVWAMHSGRREVFDPINRDDDIVVPIAIIADHAGLL